MTFEQLLEEMDNKLFKCSVFEGRCLNQLLPLAALLEVNYVKDPTHFSYLPAKLNFLNHHLSIECYLSLNLISFYFLLSLLFLLLCCLCLTFSVRCSCLILLSFASYVAAMCLSWLFLRFKKTLLIITRALITVHYQQHAVVYRFVLDTSHNMINNDNKMVYFVDILNYVCFEKTHFKSLRIK